jgi:O-antigen/teichoic acid export membrane protein
MSLQRRLFGTFGTLLLGPVVTTLVQIVNVPLMLRSWGPHLFGEWLLISTIPTYLLLTDLGFGNVAGNDMTMRSHAGDRDGAIETYQSISVLLIVLSVIIAIFVLILVTWLPLHSMLHIVSMSPQDMRNTLLILCVNCLIILQWSVIMAAYRCDGQYSIGMLYVNIIRSVEGASVLILLISHAGPLQLSMIMLVISIAGTIWLIYRRRCLVPWLSVGSNRVKWSRVRQLFGPAMAFMAFPTGSALSLQGMTMVVGLALGPLAVAVFNPMRTLSRTVFQLTDAVKNAIWPDLSAAFGRNDWALARKLHRTACQASLCLAIPAAICLALFGPRLFAIWTHGKIAMNVPAFYLLLSAVVLNAGWNASSAVPMAANKHQSTALVYLASSCGSLFVGYFALLYVGLSGACIALVLIDLVMTLHVIRTSNSLTHDRWQPFARSMFDMTQFKLIWTKVAAKLT